MTTSRWKTEKRTLEERRSDAALPSAGGGAASSSAAVSVMLRWKDKDKARQGIF